MLPIHDRQSDEVTTENVDGIWQFDKQSPAKPGRLLLKLNPHTLN